MLSWHDRETPSDALPTSEASRCPLPTSASLQAGKQLPCSHCVHASCLLAWLQQQSSCGGGKFTCPLCRADLDVQPPPSKHQGPLRSMRLAARALLLAAVELLAAAGQPPPQRARLASPTRVAGQGRRTVPAQHAIHASADVRAAAPAAEPAPAHAPADVGPPRRVTRLQARLAAAQAAPAAAAAAAAPSSRGPRRHRRRIDGMLD